MADRYIIKEGTTDPGFIYELIETGYKPIKLGTYSTKTQAEKAKAEWIARDQLISDLEDFVEKMIETYKGRLDEDEIRGMIKAS